MDFITAKLSGKLLNMLLYYVVPYFILHYTKPLWHILGRTGTHRFHAFADDAKNNILQTYVETCTMLNCYNYVPSK